MRHGKNGGKGKTAEVEEEKVLVRIRPDLKGEAPVYYVNFASVSHTEYDFTLSVLQIPHELTPDQIALAKQNKPIPIEPVLNLMFPPRLIDGLIKALTTQKEKYEQAFGSIRGTTTGSQETE